MEAVIGRPVVGSVLFEREVEELTSSEAFALVRDPDIQVAISHASRPLRWLAPDQRQRVWHDELAQTSTTSRTGNRPPVRPDNSRSTPSSGKAEPVASSR